MSKFSALTSVLKGMERKEALKLLEKELGHSTDELSEKAVLSEKQYDDLANYKRELQAQENRVGVPMTKENANLLINPPKFTKPVKTEMDIELDNLENEIAGLSTMKKAAAGIPLMQGNINPVDTAQYLRDKGTDYLANTINVGGTEQGKLQGKRIFDATTNPFNFVGGVGAADAALSIPDMVDTEGFEKMKNFLFPKKPTP